VISELLAHTDLTVDWIEFQNLTPNPIDLGGLYLSDSYSNPLRYFIPANTIVAGNSFIALSTTNFGFAFSEHGESAVLTQTSGTNVLRFIDSVDFPASDDEISFGRYTRSDGVTDFTELRANTEGTNNALPRMGPLVASEIMYKPATNLVEFVELVNISPTNVPLYDPNFPTNTWQLNGGITFAFPTNQQIASGQAIIVCATNAATFRAEYNVDPSVPVYGPYSGALNNSGDEVDIDWPGVPETNGFVPYYRADHVRYEADSPWATNAHSGGISLDRVTLEGYGNDPINWQSSAVTNGTPGTFVGNRAPIINVIGNTTVYEGDTVLLAAQATDPDQPWQTLTFAGGNLPNNSTFNTNDGTFIWPTVETNGPGVYNLQFIAADNGVHQMIVTQIVAVTVLESNLPPWLQSVTNILYPAQIPFTLDLVAT
ncbi:MAG TPA: putative Ig domain-containing protein, partial [Verrucomicrobiae bacterium]|nr:putative Ig domain-containing protein [Verrucomicrobiae bacterium]